VLAAATAAAAAAAASAVTAVTAVILLYAGNKCAPLTHASAIARSPRFPVARFPLRPSLSLLSAGIPLYRVRRVFSYACRHAAAPPRRRHESHAASEKSKNRDCMPLRLTRITHATGILKAGWSYIVSAGISISRPGGLCSYL